ncbi:MAG TPA: amidohydrolase family protein [Candidatus Dormibacteraeota bacterium]|nr:amidohydrolase family protein [Candidatus Dormibacteraeota bacterium]
MRVDAHHHFWDPSRRTYPWMGEALDSIRRPFGPADLEPLLKANAIDRSVLVQTVGSVGETREFLAMAAEHEFIGGVVGWVDLMDQRAARTIKDLRSGPGGDKLVGIRHQVQDEGLDNWLLRPDVQRGIEAVGAAGLAYDLLVRTRELPAAIETVRAHPSMRFVLDHAAKPRIAAAARDRDWENAMPELAELPNVTCKISGLVTEADWNSWNLDRLRPYIERVFEWFGPHRCMFGSDWPVCLVAATYEDVIDLVRSVVGDSEQVFGGVAARVYGIK